MQPITRRQAYSMGWNNAYCRTGHAYPPLEGRLLEAFEEGMIQGAKDRELDDSYVPFSGKDENASCDTSRSI